MLQRLKQLKKAWRLAGSDIAVVERLMGEIRANQTLANNQPIMITPEDAKLLLAIDLPVGDGDGAFFPEATEEEYQQYLRDEENGWSKFKERFFKSK